MKALGNDFLDVIKQKNVGLVGCFKGINEQEFSIMTGIAPEFYARQFETARWLIEKGANFFVYLPDLVWGGNIVAKLAKFAKRLMRIHPNLPLRAEMLAINDYAGALKNIERCAKLGRKMPETDQRLVLDAWHNQVLPNIYPQSELQKFCCQISLN